MRLALFALLLVRLVTIAEAQACAPPIESRSTIESIGFRSDGSIDSKIIQAAIEKWSECPNAATDFPQLLNGTGAREVLVTLRHGNSGDARCGEFSGARIVLWKMAMSRDGFELSCGGLVQNLAHEIGHVLGLGHIDGGPRCRHAIMGNIGAANRYSRGIALEECIAAGDAWLTPSEFRDVKSRGWIDDAGWGPPLAELLERLGRERLRLLRRQARQLRRPVQDHGDEREDVALCSRSASVSPSTSSSTSARTSPSCSKP